MSSTYLRYKTLLIINLGRCMVGLGSDWVNFCGSVECGAGTVCAGTYFILKCVVMGSFWIIWSNDIR